MIIGSHGFTHRILTNLSQTELIYELKESKRLIEKNLGQKIEYFSVPRGFYNQRITKVAKEVGYKAVFTSNPKDNDGFRFGRIAVRRNWDLEYFKKVINSGLSLKHKVQEAVKSSFKKILGAKNYYRIREIILKK